MYINNYNNATERLTTLKIEIFNPLVLIQASIVMKKDDSQIFKEFFLVF